MVTLQDLTNLRSQLVSQLETLVRPLYQAQPITETRLDNLEDGGGISILENGVAKAKRFFLDLQDGLTVEEAADRLILRPSYGIVAASIVDPTQAAAEALRIGPRFHTVTLAPLGTGASDTARRVAVKAACSTIKVPMFLAGGDWYFKTDAASVVELQGGGYVYLPASIGKFTLASTARETNLVSLPAETDNLILNPRFEKWTGAGANDKTPDLWTCTDDKSAADHLEPYSGLGGCTIVCGTTLTGVTQVVLTPGVAYRVRAEFPSIPSASVWLLTNLAGTQLRCSEVMAAAGVANTTFIADATDINVIRNAYGTYTVGSLQVYQPKGLIRCLTIGDSITQGGCIDAWYDANIAAGHEGTLFVGPMRVGTTYSDGVIGAYADASTFDAARIHTDITTYLPTHVAIMLGTNDLMVDRSSATILGELAALVALVVAEGIPLCNIIVQSIPPYNATADAAPDRANREAQRVALDAALPAWCTGQEVRFANTGGQLVTGDLGGDGVHPSVAGHVKLGKLQASVIGF